MKQALIRCLTPYALLLAFPVFAAAQDAPKPEDKTYMPKVKYTVGEALKY